jgi:tetratricopeptide (TPR) repeat protein
LEGECSEAEDLLNRSLSLDKAAGREPSQNTRLQLADIWRREGNYDRAVEAYREITNRDQNSIEAWRGYITALHIKRDDQTVLAVEQRSPAAIRARLEKDPDILVLLASAQSRLGQNHEAVRSLTQAQSAYQAQSKLAPADLDVQLAWAMLADKQNTEDPRDFLSRTRMRKDLTPKQRSTIDEIWSTWSIRRAEEVLQSKEPARAVAILTETQSILPNDPKIPAALASVYVRQHDYQKALGVYQSWGMSGAEAVDYRAAAGAALAAHKDTVAEGFLREGLQRFPNDPELLRMNAKRAVAHGNYDQAEYQLKSALSAMRNPDAEDRNGGGSGAPGAPQREDSENPGSVPNPMIGPATSDTVAGCRPKSNENASEPGEAKVKPIAAVWVEEADPTDVSDEQQPQPEQKKERQVQDEIDIVKNRNTPFFNIDELASGRPGDLGFDRLIIQDGAVGTSGAISDTVRLGFEAHGVYLFSGAPNGSSSLQLGTLPQGAPCSVSNRRQDTEAKCSCPPTPLD